MRFVFCVIVGLIVGSIATYGAMTFLNMVDHATLDHYTDQTLRGLEAERNSTRRLAMHLARTEDDSMAVEAFIGESEIRSFEKNGYLVSQGLSLYLEGGELERVCSANDWLEPDVSCQDQWSDPLETVATQ